MPAPSTKTSARFARDKHFERAWRHLGMLERYGLDLVEADIGQQPQPILAAEQAAYVPVVRHARRLPVFVQQEREVHQVGAIRRVRIERPLEIAQTATVAVIAAMVSRSF